MCHSGKWKVSDFACLIFFPDNGNLHKEVWNRCLKCFFRLDRGAYRNEAQFSSTLTTKKYDDLTHLPPVIMGGLVIRLPIIEQTLAGSEANLEEHQLFLGGG